VRKLGAAAGPSFRSLSIDFNASDPGILTAVATQPRWAGLTYLGIAAALDGSRAQLDLPAELAPAPHLRRLTRPTPPPHRLARARSPPLSGRAISGPRRPAAHLTQLHPPARRPLAAADGWSELRPFRAAPNRLGNDGVEALAGCRSRLGSLAVLDLGNNDVT